LLLSSGAASNSVCVGSWETYSGHSEVPQDTSSLSTLDTSVPDLCRASVAVHLGELQLGLRAHTRRELHVADDVAQSLSEAHDGQRGVPN